MRALDVMVRHPVTVHPNTKVAYAVELLRKHDISALPVIDDHHNLVGILSEADLLHRVEIGTERHRPSWLEAVTGAPKLAEEFAKSHGKTVSELMTTDVVSASEETSLSEIARLLEHNRIKRIPITRDGKLVGVVSRSNLIQALASSFAHSEAHSDEDAKIRSELLARLEQQSWTDFGDRNVTVARGTVHLWGLVGSDEERKALVALAETVPGVARVSDEMFRTY
jgi:CBS domain-containing protein